MAIKGIFYSKSFWVGAGAVLVYEFLPTIMKKARPAIVGLIKTGYQIADESKVLLEKGKETFEDLKAEAVTQKPSGQE